MINTICVLSLDLKLKRSFKNYKKYSCFFSEEALCSSDVCIIDLRTDRFREIKPVCRLSIAVSDKQNYISKYYFDYMCPPDIRTIKFVIETQDSQSRLKPISSNVMEILDSIGMPHKIGFGHAVYIITYFVTQNMHCTIHDAYVQCSQSSGKSVSSIERALRIAIEYTWQNGNIDEIDTLFSNSVNPNKGKPTNAEFVFLISDLLIRKRSVL